MANMQGISNENKPYKLRYFRNELLLDINQYLKPAKREELDALAQTIQNLIIIHPGTIPNDPLFGVGISSYLFEILDNQTISEIQLVIENQISRYIIHPNTVVTANVSKLNSDTMVGVNSLKITINIATIKDVEESIEIDYVFAGNKRTQKVISKLITG